LCKSAHDKSHYIIDYDLKDFSTKEHNESYISYCNDCKNDICILCQKEHVGHKIITYGDIMPEIGKSEKELHKLKEAILEFKKNINEIIVKLNKLMKNLDDYYEIYNEIIKNFDAKKRNYYIIKNTNEINSYNIDFINILKTISKDKNIKNKISNIVHLFNKMTFREEVNANKDNKVKTSDISINKSKIKFTTDYSVHRIIRLNDGRILTEQSYEDDDDKYKYKVCIYNLKYDFVICDICVDYSLGEVIQMEDDNIIQKKNDILQVTKIKKYSLEEVQTINICNYHGVYKLSKEKILVRSSSDFHIFLYQNGKLTLTKKFKKGKINFSYDSCEIKEDEIAIYCTKEGLISDNDFLIFYDVKNNIEIKALKLGGSVGGCQKICLFNNNRLIINYGPKFIIIDIINRKILNEIKIKEEIETLFLFEDKFPLFKYYNDQNLHLCEIMDSNMNYCYSHFNLGRNEIFGGIYIKNNIFLIKDKKIKIKNIYDL